MKNRPGNLIPAVIVILAIAAFLGVLAYAIWPSDKEFEVTPVAVKNKNTNVTVNTNSAAANGNVNTNTAVDATAGWKTFTNTSLGYTVKYPADWKNSTCTGNNAVWFGTQGVVCASDASTWDFAITEQPASFNLEQTLLYTKSLMVEPVQTSATISGVAATRLSGQTKVDIGPGSNRFNDTVYVSHGGRYYTLGYSADGVIGDEFKNNFEAFLKSFTFTK